jgi:hypothetical protein
VVSENSASEVVHMRQYHEHQQRQRQQRQAYRCPKKQKERDGEEEEMEEEEQRRGRCGHRHLASETAHLIHTISCSGRELALVHGETWRC